MHGRWIVALAGLSLVGASVAGCRRGNAPAPAGHVAYVVGQSWESTDHAWFYPQERFNFSETGLSDALNCGGETTADGEICDPGMPEAAIQSLQIPAILRVTNLENGLQVLVRANDRGPASPSRVIGLNARARSMLGILSISPARVRIEVDTLPSEQLKSELDPTARQATAAAPVPDVAEKPLDGASAALDVQHQPAASDPAAVSAADMSALLSRQNVERVPVSPTALMVDAGRFSDRQVAQTVADDIAGTVTTEGGGKYRQFHVEAGPFGQVEDADAALNQAPRQGDNGGTDCRRVGVVGWLSEGLCCSGLAAHSV